MENNTIKLTNKLALTIAHDLLSKQTESVNDNFSNDEIATKLNSMIISMDKKSSGNSKKQQEKAEENEALTGIILDVLNSCLNPNGMNVTEIVRAADNESITTSRATTLLRKLLESDRVINHKVKGRSYYALA